MEYRSSWKVVPPFLLLRPDSIAVRRHSTVNIVNQQSKHKEAVFLNNRKENRFFFCAFTGCCYLTEDISYELYGEKTTLECVTYFALLACPFYELWLERLIVGLDGRTDWRWSFNFILPEKQRMEYKEETEMKYKKTVAVDKENC